MTPSGLTIYAGPVSAITRCAAAGQATADELIEALSPMVGS
jgi:hypothetical protein